MSTSNSTGEFGNLDKLVLVPALPGAVLCTTIHLSQIFITSTSSSANVKGFIWDPLVKAAVQAQL